MRYNIAILVVVSLNGGWTADPQRNKPGRNLGYTRFDKIIQQADLESQIKKNGQLVFRDQRAVKSRSGASASRSSASTY